MNKIEDVKYWAHRPANDERKDWRNGGKNWVDEYVKSKDHPHRDLILKALQQFEPIDGVLEVGCNAGPNLLRLREVYPRMRLAGCDVNGDAVRKAIEVVEAAIIKMGNANFIPFEDKEYDFVLADAVLMYVKDIDTVLDELERVSRRGLIIVDWYSPSESIIDFHHARNYPKLLEDRGYSVEVVPLTDNDWPSPTWVKNGRVFIAVRASQISKPSWQSVQDFLTGVFRG